MARLNINIGTTANDKTGDPLRTAFDKVNQNFVELYAHVGADVQIPSQSGNNGKYLTTNGTTLSWGTVASTDTGVVRFNNNVVHTSAGQNLVVNPSNDSLNKIVIPGAGNGGSFPLSLTNTEGNVTITANSKTWQFNTTGTLDLPTSNSGVGTVQSPAGIWLNANGVLWQFNSNGSIDFPLVNGTTSLIRSSGNTTINSNGKEWMFNSSGTLTFPNGGSLRVSAAPANSTGASGDKAGSVAFDGNYIYYCTADYVAVGGGGGASASLVPNELGQSVNTITIAKGAPPNTNWADPQVGWTLTVNSTTVTVEEITGDVDNLYIVVSGFITLPPTGSITFTEPGGTQPDIWKRVAWSNDTW